MVNIVHAKSPLRLGLAGGGTDVSPYSEQFGGLVLNTTINLSTQCRIVANDVGKVVFTAVDYNEEAVLPLEAQFPLEGGLILHRAVYNRIIRQFNGNRPLPIKVMTFSDVPSGSGIGSSSSLVVAMVQAYAELLQLSLGEYDIAHLAFEIERQDCAMAGGKQDQYAATFGGFNFMEFGGSDHVLINPLRLKSAVIHELETHLLLYYTGRSRESARIIESQIAAVDGKKGAAIGAMHDVKQAAIDMKDALLRGRIVRVLEILGQSWAAKVRMAEGIANSEINEIAAAASAAGAIGLKISGAGGGGFMMIGVDVRDRYKVIRALEEFGGRFFFFNFVNEGVRAWKVG
jgi:D-glycero-alpha-D-manno-heptose-7-phosphate kinase